MPTFRFMVTCEKVIIDQSGPVSLIAIFQKINIQRTATPLPERAMSYIRWHAFSVWNIDPKEAGKTFIFVVKAFNPDGSVLSESEVPVPTRISDSEAKINVMYQAVPIWQEGNVVVQVWVKGNETERGECQFSIVYLPKEVNAEAAKSIN